MLWTKQFYYYVVEEWLKGDTTALPPPPERMNGRNHEWIHLYNDDVLSMLDKWEFPWFTVWDAHLSRHSPSNARILILPNVN